MTTPRPDAGHAHPPLLTFAVTCFNQADIIGNAIAGALAQEYGPLEILISDDASTDDSLVAIDRAIAGYDGPHRIVVNRNDRNRGIAGHYDRLSEIASGELIVCADGDDVSLPHRATRFAEAWLASGKRALLIHGPCRMFDDAGVEQAVVSPPDIMRRSPDPSAIIDDYLYVIGANFGWTKRLHQHFGPMARHALIDDHVLPFRAALLGELAYIDEPLVRKYPGGMANLAVAQTGHDRLFGLHLKELPWKIGDYRQMEADLTRVQRPDRDRLIARARRIREFYEMEHRMATASGPAHRLAMLPGELGRALRHRSRSGVVSALRYATAPLSTHLIDRRLRRGRNPASNGA